MKIFSRSGRNNANDDERRDGNTSKLLRYNITDVISFLISIEMPLEWKHKNKNAHQLLSQIIVWCSRFVEIRWSEQDLIVHQSFELMSYLSTTPMNESIIFSSLKRALIQFVLRFSLLSSKTFFWWTSENATFIVHFRLDNVQEPKLLFTSQFNRLNEGNTVTILFLFFRYYNAGKLATKSYSVCVLKLIFFSVIELTLTTYQNTITSVLHDMKCGSLDLSSEFLCHFHVCSLFSIV